MNEPKPSSDAGDLRSQISREDLMSALFANMIIQQTNMALIFLGKAPHPETGERVQDIEAAQMFIDQLEMLETKTKGNLNKREEELLKQSLMTLRMAFVEAVEKGEQPAAKKESAPAAATSAPPADETKPSTEAPASAEEAESRKKFSKKY